MHVSRALAEWSLTPAWDRSEPPARSVVLNALVDTVAVTVAASIEPEAPAILELVRGLGLTGDEASLWGTDAAMAATGAALANGTLSHLMDFDDIHYLIHGHPSAVLFPALLAVGEARLLSGEAVLTGYLAGIGAMAATSRIFGPDHYTRGWHSTATTGAIGAAVGVAAALDLSLDARVCAINAAASMAGGLRANFGTVLKPMHAGLAARAGLEAVAVAEAGFAIDTDALGAHLGAVDVYGDGSWPGDSADPLADMLAAADNSLEQIGIKPYPSCTGGHWAIEATLDARAQLGAVDWRDIAQIDVDVPRGAKVSLLYDDPTTGLQSKFSLPYAVATAAARGLPSPMHFTDSAVHESDVRQVMTVVTVSEDASGPDTTSDAALRYADVRLTMRDGRTGRGRVTQTKGSWNRPMAAADVDAKFLACTESVIGGDAAAGLLVRLRSIADSPNVHGLPGLERP